MQDADNYCLTSTSTYNCTCIIINRISSKSRRTSNCRRVVLTLNALNAALEFSPHVVKGRHYYLDHEIKCRRGEISVVFSLLKSIVEDKTRQVDNACGLMVCMMSKA